MNNRIKELRTELNLTQAQFANLLGVAEMTVQRWEYGKASMKESSLRLIETTFDVNPDWLRGGREEMFLSERKDLAKVIRDAPSYVFRPDIYAAAGVGYINTNEHEVELLTVDERVSRRLGMGKNIEVIQVKGDSMAPKYSDNDFIFVDRADNRFTSEGIYVVLYEGTLMVKYLQKIKGGIRIRSLNREMYDDIDFTGNEFNDNQISIVGKVRGAITFM